jgi:hypothetical protein
MFAVGRKIVAGATTARAPVEVARHATITRAARGSAWT